MGFSRPEYGVGSLSLLQGDLNPGDLTRDLTQVSHIAGGFFTSWATREAPLELDITLISCEQCVSLMFPDSYVVFLF